LREKSEVRKEIAAPIEEEGSVLRLMDGES